MQTVKLTYPAHWQKDDLWSNYQAQSPDQQGVWGAYRFEINNDCKVCDYWVVHGNLDSKTTVKVRKATIFITSETETAKIWHPKFLSQFDVIITTQPNVPHSFVIRDQYICPWQVQKTYNELKTIQSLPKTQILSAVVSDSTWLAGHKKRFAFVNQLKGHFKNRLDWYGKGNIYLKDKWDGLAAYQYSIAIENSVHPHYWTEKLADCFLALTMPIYFGCPDVLDYFPAESMILIDWNDLEGSIEKIENAIANQQYEKYFDALVEAKRLVLEHYQIFPKIGEWLSNEHLTSFYKTKQTTLSPDTFYLKEKIYKKIFRKIKEISHS